MQNMNQMGGPGGFSRQGVVPSAQQGHSQMARYTGPNARPAGARRDNMGMGAGMGRDHLRSMLGGQRTGMPMPSRGTLLPGQQPTHFNQMLGTGTITPQSPYPLGGANQAMQTMQTMQTMQPEMVNESPNQYQRDPMGGDNFDYPTPSFGLNKPLPPMPIQQQLQNPGIQRPGGPRGPRGRGHGNGINRLRAMMGPQAQSPQQPTSMILQKRPE